MGFSAIISSSQEGTSFVTNVTACKGFYQEDNTTGIACYTSITGNATDYTKSFPVCGQDGEYEFACPVNFTTTAMTFTWNGTTRTVTLPRPEDVPENFTFDHNWQNFNFSVEDDHYNKSVILTPCVYNGSHCEISDKDRVNITGISANATIVSTAWNDSDFQISFGSQGLNHQVSLIVNSSRMPSAVLADGTPIIGWTWSNGTTYISADPQTVTLLYSTVALTGPLSYLSSVFTPVNSVLILIAIIVVLGVMLRPRR